MRLIALFIFYSIFSVQAQEPCSKVYVLGKVVDTLQYQPFYNLMVVNRTIGKGVFGQPDGNFSVYANPNDSITLSVKGYPMYGFRVIPDSNCQMKILGILMNRIFEEKEVIVRPIKTLQEIKEERANLSLRETRLVTGIEVMNSPITALYQRFSQKEQSKQWVAKMEYKDNQMKVLKELLRVYISYDIVDLDEDEFENFIGFLNMDEDFLKTSSDMELVTFIKDKYEHFRRVNSPHIEVELPPKKRR
jgi:hypothetical protein